MRVCLYTVMQGNRINNNVRILLHDDDDDKKHTQSENSSSSLGANKNILGEEKGDFDSLID